MAYRALILVPRQSDNSSGVGLDQIASRAAKFGEWESRQADRVLQLRHEKLQWRMFLTRVKLPESESRFAFRTHKESLKEAGVTEATHIVAFLLEGDKDPGMDWFNDYLFVAGTIAKGGGYVVIDDASGVVFGK